LSGSHNQAPGSAGGTDYVKVGEEYETCNQF